MAKKIPLTQGYEAIVDDADYEWLSQWQWRASRIRNIVYAFRKVKRVNSKQECAGMHQVIMDTVGKGIKVQVDHINHDGLDNRRENLRIVSTRGNGSNRRKKYTSKYTGVSWHLTKWRSAITIGKKTIHIGLFEDEKEAALAYDRVAYEWEGEGVYLNFPEELGARLEMTQCVTERAKVQGDSADEDTKEVV